MYSELSTTQKEDVKAVKAALKDANVVSEELLKKAFVVGLPSSVSRAVSVSKSEYLVSSGDRGASQGIDGRVSPEAGCCCSCKGCSPSDYQ